MIVIIDLNKKNEAIQEEENEGKEGKINGSNSIIPFDENENESDIEVEQCSDDEVRKYVRTYVMSCNQKYVNIRKEELINLNFFINFFS